jgi:hypothetical protein
LQLSALRLMTWVNIYVSLASVETVKAQNLVYNDGIVRTPISPEQWISEVQRWEAIVWASSQVTISDYVIGPTLRDPGIAEYVISPETSGDEQLCGSFKMRKAGGFV